MGPISCSGGGRAGFPVSLFHALIQRGVKNLMAIMNNPGFDYEELFANEQIVRLISPFLVAPFSFVEDGQTLRSCDRIEAG